MTSEQAYLQKFHTDVEEIEYGPAMWLWDYLRRSGARGFFLPLSGGSDSGAVAALVASMANQVFKSIEKGDKDVLADIRRVVKDEKFTPQKY